MSSPEFVPDSFLKNLLDDFGLQWTQLAILVGVGVSTLGLEDYVASGPWIFGAIAGLGLASLFKESLSLTFNRAFLIVSIVFVLALVGGLVLERSGVFSVADTLAENRNATSLALGAVTAAALGMVILAYRKTGDLNLEALPEDLEAVADQLRDTTTYREYHQIVLRFLSVDDSSVKVETDVQYTLVNRAPRNVQVSCGLTGKDALRMECTYARVGDDFLDTDDWAYNTTMGFAVPVTIPARDSVFCKFVGTQVCYTRDSLVLTSYQPAGSFEIRIINDVADVLRVVPTSWGIESLERLDERGELVLRSSKAVLPYTGVRVHWLPHTNTNTDDRVQAAAPSPTSTETHSAM